MPEEREVSCLGGEPIEVTVTVSGYVSRAVSRTGEEPVQADVSNNGSAVFSVSEPGSYSMDIPANQRDDKRDNTKPYIWICILGILLCGGLTVWFCRGKGGGEYEETGNRRKYSAVCAPFEHIDIWPVRQI